MCECDFNQYYKLSSSCIIFQDNIHRLQSQKNTGHCRGEYIIKITRQEYIQLPNIFQSFYSSLNVIKSREKNIYNVKKYFLNLLFNIYMTCSLVNITTNC